MASTYELIASQTLGSAAASITLSSIPATFDDLVLVASLRTDVAVVAPEIRLSFNGVTTNLSGRIVYGSGSSAGSNTYASVIADFSTGASATANTFGFSEFVIPNYAGSTNKSISYTFAVEHNSTTSNLVGAGAGLWASTAAITSLTATPASGNLVTGSSVWLYGISHS